MDSWIFVQMANGSKKLVFCCITWELHVARTYSNRFCCAQLHTNINVGVLQAPNLNEVKIKQETMVQATVDKVVIDAPWYPHSFLYTVAPVWRAAPSGKKTNWGRPNQRCGHQKPTVRPLDMADVRNMSVMKLYSNHCLHILLRRNCYIRQARRLESQVPTVLKKTGTRPSRYFFSSLSHRQTTLLLILTFCP